MIAAHSLKPVPCGDSHYARAASTAFEAARKPRDHRVRKCLRRPGEWTGYGRCSQLLAMGWSDCDGCPGAHNFHRGEQPSG